MAGDLRWYAASTTRLGAGQELTILILKDITEQKKRERALARTKDEAERLDRLKSAFLINVSHEVRTPLTSMIGFAETIRDEVSTKTASEDERIDHFAEQIEKSGKRLMRTIDDLLDLSKLEAGMTETDEGSVDLGAQARFVAEEFQSAADKKRVELTVENEAASVVAQANRPGVRAVLRNLVSNAVKFVDEGGRVSIRTRSGPQGALLEVEDDGIGMDPEKAEGYFEPFEQARGGNGGESGGLGLALVRRATEEMNGAIELDTEKGVGTLIRIILPEADGEPRRRAEAGGRTASAERRTGSRTGS